MAWRRPGDKQLSESRMESSLRHICVTRPQWVNEPTCPLPSSQPSNCYSVMGDTLVCVHALGNLEKAAHPITMTCYMNCANIAVGNYKLTVSSKLCFSLMRIFFVDWAAHHPEELSFSNSQFNEKITLSVSFLSVHLWLLTCLIPTLTFVDCITFFLRCYISI